MSAFREDANDEDRTALTEEDVAARVSDSLGHLHMSRTLDQIAARGFVHRRRRNAVTAMASVAVVTALGATVALAQTGTPTNATSAANGSAGSTGSLGAPNSTDSVRMTDPDWTITAAPAGGYTVAIASLGDVPQLNAALKALGIEIKVAETTPTATGSGCSMRSGTGPTTTNSPTGTATSSSSQTSTTSSSSTSTSTSTSTTLSSPTSTTSSPTSTMATGLSTTGSPTPITFPAPGTPAGFTFDDLPKASVLSFTATSGKGQALLGTVGGNDQCQSLYSTYGT